MQRRRRRWPPFAALAVAVPAAVAFVAAPAQAATPTNGGVYTLANGSSGKCLEVAGGSADNGALLQQASCVAGSVRQQWRVQASGAVFTLVNVGSTRCADVPSSSTASGVQLQQWGCGDGLKPPQQWQFAASGAASGKFRVTSVVSGLCMSNRDGSTAGNNPVVQETCSDVSRMQWLFNQVGGAPTDPGAPVWSNNADGFAAGTTGGAGGTTVTVNNLADLKRYAAMSGSHVIRVNSTITVTPYGAEIPVASNKTIIGVGRTGRISGGGFILEGSRNVIIRNLIIGDTLMASDDPDDKDFDYDGIQMDGASNVWIDHNAIARTNDGLIDSREDTTNLTVSWNNMGNTNKAFGIGWTSNVTSRMTIHHNWIHDTNQRNPSTDNVAYAHLYNNYLQNIASYGNLSRGGTRMALENSYFERVNNPYYNDTSAAQLRQSGSIVVNCTGRQQTNGSAFTPSSFYAYRLDPAADVPSLLRAFTGPQASIGI